VVQTSNEDRTVTQEGAIAGKVLDWLCKLGERKMFRVTLAVLA
jgi:hypothetical protein